MKERIKNILKEETLKKTLIDMVQEEGCLETAELVGGVENLLEILNVETPMDFLHLFDNLKRFKSEEYPSWLLFVNESKDNLIAYNMNKDMVYIHMELVWYFLMNYFNMTYQEIQVLTEEWLSESYNLTGVQTHSGSQDFMESLL